MSVIVWKNGKSQNTWSSPLIVDGERVSVAKQSHASADGLATAQQTRDFAANMGGLRHQLCEFVCSCWSCIHFQMFFARVPSAHTRKLRDPPSIVDREPQERVSPRNRPHCYIGKMRWKEQRSRRVVLALWKLCFQSNPFAQSTFSFNSRCLDFFLAYTDHAEAIAISRTGPTVNGATAQSLALERPLKDRGAFLGLLTICISPIEQCALVL